MDGDNVVVLRPTLGTGWGREEIAEISALFEPIARRIGLEFHHGLTDEGEPYAVLITVAGDTVLRLERAPFGDDYLAVLNNGDVATRGHVAEIADVIAGRWQAAFAEHRRRIA